MHVIVNEWIFKQKSKITCASVAPILFGTTRKLSMRTLASITSHALRRSDGQSSPPPRFSTKWSRHHNEFFFCLFPVFHFVCHVSFTQYRRHKTKNNTKAVRTEIPHSVYVIIWILINLHVIPPYLARWYNFILSKTLPSKLKSKYMQR